MPVSAEDWKPIAKGFLDRWNFPHTLGALDGKHVACKCPPGSGSEYYNYKKFYSIVLLALVDSNYKFIWADIGGRGAASDAQVWNDSDLQDAVISGDVTFPPPDPLPNDTQDVPYFLIGKYLFFLYFITIFKCYYLIGIHMLRNRNFCDLTILLMGFFPFFLYFQVMMHLPSDPTCRNPLGTGALQGMKES